MKKNTVTNSAFQINPLLYFINRPSQTGWITERFVNLMMYDGVVDYVDNVDFYGLFNQLTSYSIDELNDFHEVLQNAIVSDQFAILWVDEYFIPVSVRYQWNHFVHPLVVFGYNKETAQYDTIFFDISKGQRVTKIAASELYDSLNGVRSYYMSGGSIDAVNQTLTVVKPKISFKADFHLDLFIKNLSHYLFCVKESEWYSSPRKELYNNPNVVYGVQLYRTIITELKSVNCKINYKSLHDFVKHKEYLYERLLYIGDNYNISEALKKLIGEFGEHAARLEKIRLLNMKYQSKNGQFPATLCFDSEYIEKLIKSLEQEYAVELDLLPQILHELNSLQYSEEFTATHLVLTCPVNLKEKKDGLYTQTINFDSSVYSCRVDVAGIPERHSACRDKIIINDDYIYLINRHYERFSCVCSIYIHPIQIKKIELQSKDPVSYTVNVISLPGQDTAKTVFDPELRDKFDNIYQMEPISNDPSELRFAFQNEDPYIFKTGFSLNTAHFRYLHIEMKIVGTSKKAQVFFTDVASQIWYGERMVEFETVPDGESHTYVVDMSSNPNWNGFVGGLRFDPADYNNDCPFSTERLTWCSINRFYFTSEV